MRDERKLATVLFADLVGSTALAGDQDPERTRALLERFYEAMASEVEQAGGVVEKFAGDAVMAAFGAPAALEDHAERALHAALAMQKRLAATFGPELELRIGVNTGEVVFGRAREGSSFVSGDAVNMAARLEQAAAPGEIVVGERTVAAVQGAFEFDDPSTVEAKGKPDGIRSRRLLRALSLMRPRGFGGLGPVFVGREAELRLLEDAYRATTADQTPRLVVLVGESGAGKTTLVRKLWEALSGSTPEPIRRTGRCLPYGQAVTYWALGEILREHLGLLDSDSAEEELNRLGDRRILGLTLGLDLGGDLHPLAARDRLQEAWVELAEEIVAERPLVVLVEDVHWAEPPLLDLIERLRRDVRGRLLLVCTGRPEILERRGSWSEFALRLEPLPETASARLVDELLAGPAPAWVREFAVQRAEGNPFFVEELLRTLIDRGVITREVEEWQGVEPPEGLAVPDTVHALVAARIDLLGPDEKAALQAASVIGRVFWSGPVYELVAGASPDLRVLEDRDFIRRRPGSSLADEREYAFKHGLTREVAYGTLPKSERAGLHATFARWLERAQGGDEHAALLAHHFAEAVRPEDADLAWADAPEELDELRERALVWLRRAAELAVSRYDIDDAVALLGRATELAPEDADLWRRLGEAQALRFDGQGLWDAMERALALTPDPAAKADVYAELAFQTCSRYGMWRTLPPDELIDGWIRQVLEVAPPESPLRAKVLIARSYHGPVDAGEAALEASRLAELSGSLELRSYAFDARSVVAFKSNAWADALSWQQRRFDLLSEIRDPDHQHDIYASTIPPTFACGNIAEARRLAAENDRLCSTLTDHHRVHGISILLEVEELSAGWEAIVELEERALRAVEDNVETPCIRNGRSLLVAALAREQLGSSGAARSLEERAAEVRLEGHPHALASVLLRLALVRGDFERAEEIVSSETSRHQSWFLTPLVAARLDALVFLGDRKGVEDEAPQLLVAGTYLEPFALRALGLARQDEALVAQSVSRFQTLGLERHANETERMAERGWVGDPR